MLTRRSVLAAVLAVCGLLLLSATPALAADGKVQGHVTLNGKPLSAGKITFHLPNGQFVGARLNKDGTYAVDRVPVGTWKVTIEGADVPVRYSSEGKSSLQVEVRKGTNTLDFALAR